MANRRVPFQLVRDELKSKGLTASEGKVKAIHSCATRLVQRHGQDPIMAVKNAVAKGYSSHFASLTSASRPVKTEVGLFHHEDHFSSERFGVLTAGHTFGMAKVRVSDFTYQAPELRVVGGVGSFRVPVSTAVKAGAIAGEKYTISPVNPPAIERQGSVERSVSDGGSREEPHVDRSDSESLTGKKEGSDFDMFLALVFGSLSIAATYLLVRAGMVVFGSTPDGIVQSVMLEASMPIIHTLRFSQPLARCAKNTLLVAMMACSVLVVHTSVDVKAFEAADKKFGFTTNSELLNLSAKKLAVEQGKQIKKETSFVTKTKQTLEKVMESNNAVLEIYKVSGFKKASEHQRYSSLAMQVVLIVLNLIFFGQFIVMVKRIVNL